jgi:hypothetical protein
MSLDAEKHRKSQMKMHRIYAFLKSSFAKSMLSRSDMSLSSYAPESVGHDTMLLERAVAARSTMRAWCDLVNTVAPAVVTTPLPAQLTEMQARMPSRYCGRDVSMLYHSQIYAM